MERKQFTHLFYAKQKWFLKKEKVTTQWFNQFQLDMNNFPSDCQMFKKRQSDANYLNDRKQSPYIMNNFPSDCQMFKKRQLKVMLII